MNDSDLDGYLDPGPGVTTPSHTMELYSIVLSATMLFLGILFGGGGCVTVLIAMCVHKLMRKLRYVLLAILLFVCCLFDFVWCPIEISRLILHHHNTNGNIVEEEVIQDLKLIGSSLYILLLSALAAIIILVCVQTLLKLVRKYDGIPKIKFGIIVILVWLLCSVSLTITYIIVSLGDEDERVYHSINRTSFYFKIGVQAMWIFLLLLPLGLMIFAQVQTRVLKSDILHDTSDLHSNENFTVPSLIIKSVEDLEEDDSTPLPSPDPQKENSTGDSPVSRSSKSALKKRSGSPSSQKVLFAADSSPTKEHSSSNFGEKLKVQNHLGVNMAAILGRRRHTIAQINEPHLDLLNKAKSYNYVRKFSVDISALQAQLENPKIHESFPFHSQQDIKTTGKNGSENRLEALSCHKSSSRRPSREETLKSQNIAEEPELERELMDKEPDATNKNTASGQAGESTDCTSVNSQCPSMQSTRSARDSICPTPPLISLTQSDGEQKPLDPNSEDSRQRNSYNSMPSKKRVHKPCKLSCLLVITFVISILPMFVTELFRDSCLTPNSYVNIITCMTAISIVQTMIYPQIIFCVDARINKAVHQSFVAVRRWMMHFFHQQEEVPTNEDVSDTEV